MWPTVLPSLELKQDLRWASFLTSLDGMGFGCNRAVHDVPPCLYLELMEHASEEQTIPFLQDWNSLEH